jgi:hypothetical protein
MSLFPFATVLTIGLAFPVLGMAQTFNPLWGVPSTAINGSGHEQIVVPAANPSPRANFFAGVAGYGPQLKAVPAASHSAVASTLPVSN